LRSKALATQTALDTIGQVPDEWWSLIAPLLGPEKAPGTPGRPAVPVRRICDGILDVGRTGWQWRALPRAEDAPKSTVWGRFQQWTAAGGFQQAWLLVLVYSDLAVGIEWQGQALEGVIPKAPLGGEATGPSPGDRAKAGTTRSVLRAGRGAPLAAVVAGANVPDTTLALETGDGVQGLRPEKVVKRVPHLCVDAGYEDAAVIAGRLERDDMLHLKHRREPTPAVRPEKTHPARRWVVERTHAWHNKCRRLVVRWEKTGDHYYAMLDLASLLIVYRLIAATDT
jgi:putative transposase